MKKTNVLSNNDQIKRGHKKRKKENKKEDFKIKILNFFYQNCVFWDHDIVYTSCIKVTQFFDFDKKFFTTFFYYESNL